MNFDLDIPSLAHISLVKYAFTIWQSSTPFNSNFKFIPNQCNLVNFSQTSTEMWEKKETEICQKVNFLIIPNAFKIALKKFIKEIGLELRSWICYLLTHGILEIRTENVMKCIKSTQWTPYGKIDRRKTAEIYSRMQVFTIREKLNIVGWVHVPDATIHVWDQVSDPIKQICKATFQSNPTSYVNFFWYCQLGGDVSQISKKLMFFTALYYLNYSAVKYLWSVMNEEEKKSCILSFIHGNLSDFEQLIIHRLLCLNLSLHSDGISIVCFILSQMNEEELDCSWFLRKIPFELLAQLLRDSCYVQFFMPILIRVIGSLDHFLFSKFFVSACAYPLDCVHSYKINELLKQMWMMATAEMKQRFLANEEDVRNACSLLCLGNNIGFLELVLSEFSEMDTSEILSECLFKMSDNDNCGWDWWSLAAEKLLTTNAIRLSFKSLCFSVLFNTGNKEHNF